MKSQDEDLWVKKIKEVLSDYTEPVPAGGWESLEKKMQPVPRRRYSLKWRVGAAAAVLVAVSVMSLFFLHTDVADELRQTSVPLFVSAPDIVPETSRNDILHTPLEPVKRVATASREAIISSPVSAVASVVMQLDEKDTLPADIHKEKIVQASEKHTNVSLKPETEQRPLDKEAERKVVRPSGKDKLHLPVVDKKKRSGSSEKGWALALNMNSGTLTSSSKETNAGPVKQMTDNISDLISNGVVDIPSDQTLIFKEGIPYIVNRKDIMDYKHHQPVSVGISVRKELKNRFSVETGLMYTLLSSDVKTVEDESKKMEQKLHYLGIPLKANWDFVDSDKFTLYVSAGGAVERCIYGKTAGKKNTVDELQFSLSGAVGAQYNASSKVGLYIEPGFAYYFDDGSDVATIRKEKQFNVNIQAGIRFTY